MKKVLFIAVMALLGFGNLNAQEGAFNVGVNLGLPTGDASDATSFAASLEANYLFDITSEFKVGPSISYLHYFGKSDILGTGIDAEDASFLPLAAAGRFAASDKFTLGVDLGYGFAISPEELEGAFYYRPMIGYTINDSLMLQATFAAMTKEGETVSNFGIGIMYGL
ncbi:outer membrane beta-barrel protein [uncultured Polaribacter sp.]|uniref:outer membrane beta-barrel protein n=1 Tax=uncultured Polaribacter sp. TaxID=174711 RepID=UPI002613E3D3|nr:outer membrane beta-barrel protein [uncultured Polaribacter sp.]